MTDGQNVGTTAGNKSTLDLKKNRKQHWHEMINKKQGNSKVDEGKEKKTQNILKKDLKGVD